MFSFVIAPAIKIRLHWHSVTK